MKKSVTLFLAAILCLGLFAGCGKETSSSGDGSAQMKDGESVQTVVDKIVDEIGMQMPSDIDDGIYKDLFYIDTAADCEEYYGKMAMTMTSADNVVAIKAKPDKKQTVVDGLTKRLEDVRNSFAQYLPDQSEKAQKGQVIEKGDYVFLLILGSDVEKFDAEMENAVKIINEAFA